MLHNYVQAFAKYFTLLSHTKANYRVERYCNIFWHNNIKQTPLFPCNLYQCIYAVKILSLCTILKNNLLKHRPKGIVESCPYKNTQLMSVYFVLNPHWTNLESFLPTKLEKWKTLKVTTRLISHLVQWWQLMAGPVAPNDMFPLGFQALLNNFTNKYSQHNSLEC